MTSPNTSGASAAGTAHPEPSARAGHRYGLVGRSVAEAAGTALLIFAGFGLTIFSTQGGVPAPFGFGLGLAAAMVAFGYVSGGHFNPAITVGSAVAGRTPWIAVAPYVVAQLIGAVFGVFVLWTALSGYPQVTSVSQIFAQSVNSFGEDSALGFPLAGALLLEVIAAALLTAVFLGATAGSGVRSGAAPFAVGLAYAVLLAVLGPVTGGGLNPARSTAPVLFADFSGGGQLWLFWVAPLVGAVITGLIYRSIDLVPGAAERIGHDAAETGPAAEGNRAEVHTQPRTAGTATAATGTAAAGTETTDAGTDVAEAGPADAGNTGTPDGATGDAARSFDTPGDDGSEGRGRS